MLEFLSFLPVILIIILLIGFKLPSKKTMPIALAVTVLLTLVFWKMGIVEIAAFSLTGAFKAVDVLVIIFGGILLLNTLAFSGGLSALSRSLGNISRDPRVQAILIGWCFVSFLESAAGFGTPAALAAPILVVLGFPPMAAVSFTLICNTTANVFGAVGTPTLTQLSLIGGEAAAQGITNFSTDLPMANMLIHAMVGIFVPLIASTVMMLVFGRKKSIKPILEITPFALFAGAAFVVPATIATYFFGPEIPSLLGSLVSLVIVGLAAKFGFLVPKKIWSFREHSEWAAEWKAKEVLREKHEERQMGSFHSWLPYIIVSLILFITRLPFLHVRDLFKNVALNITGIFGVEGANWTFEWLWLPGTVFIVVALITILIHKMNLRMFKSAFKKTVKQTSGAVIALTCAIATMYLMMNSGVNNSGLISMMGMIAKTLANTLGPVYIAIAPLIGALGAFISGSATISNIIFSTTQFNAAMLLSLNPIIILALQCAGATAGNMIAISNIVAASTMVNLPEKTESKIVRLNIIPMFIVIVLIILASFGVTALMGF